MPKPAPWTCSDPLGEQLFPAPSMLYPFAPPVTKCPSVSPYVYQPPWRPSTGARALSTSKSEISSSAPGQFATVPVSPPSLVGVPPGLDLQPKTASPAASRATIPDRILPL